ncbi:MAG TPA: cytochrome ubiquinol oxidase subunit I, partial [Usitatibacter sp.]|nr:cytochrome ubiquinol oxidase subunit I [Usitatibacter sp.]
AMVNRYEVKVPYVLGLIGTRSTSKTIPGIKEISARNRDRIVSGIEAVAALEGLRRNPRDAQLRATFEQHRADLGYGLLLRQYTTDVRNATPAMIDMAVDETVPRVWPLFWAFRVMVALAFAMLVLFALAFHATLKRQWAPKPWLLRWALWFLPAPWVAAELGWFVAEYGRQPWTIFGVLPTHMSASTLTVASLYGSLAGFVAFYTALFVVEMYLMFKYARKGPAEAPARPVAAGGGMHPLPAARAGEGS